MSVRLPEGVDAVANDVLSMGRQQLDAAYSTGCSGAIPPLSGQPAIVPAAGRRCR